MDLFDLIPDEFMADVSQIVNNDEWDKEQKLDLLKEIVDGPLMLKKFEEYLEGRNATPVSSPSSFILLLPCNEQRLANTFLENGNIGALDVLIQTRKDESKLRAAYIQWKAYYKQEKEKEILSGPKLSDTHVDLSPNKELLQRLPKETNIVFLGGTGSGKSTLINGLVNYLNFESLDEAIQQGPTVLIPFVITEYDEQLREHTISVRPTAETEAGLDANEVNEAGESATQSPRAYQIHYKVGNENKLMRIIDTPGVADPRGHDVEKLNMEKILSFLSQYDEIHAFCITMKSNESRRTLNFKYCLNQLLIQLHHTASANIMFCLTNGGATQYKPGDSFPCLRAHAKEVRTARNINIKVDNKTVHCFENDCFRYICAAHSNQGRTYTDEQKQLFGLSWKHSSAAAVNMLSNIVKIRPHQLVDTVSINNCRTAISALSQPLAEIYRNQAVNQRLMEEKMAKVQQCQREGKNLEEHLYMEEFILKVKETEYPLTVCTAPKCVAYERLMNDNSQRLKPVYKVCHSRCYLQQVEPQATNNLKLKYCTAMGNTVKGGETCKGCKCNWSTHMHIYYKYVEEKIKIRVPDVEQGLAKNEQLKERVTLFLKKTKERMAELEEEMKRIRKYCAEIACFLRAHALLHYNDKFDEYIDHLIQEERGKVSAGALEDVLQDLIYAKEDYCRQVKLLITDTKHPPKTLEEINKMIEELKEMKVNGNILREIQKINLRYNREVANRSASNVSIGNGFRRLFSSIVNTSIF